MRVQVKMMSMDNKMLGIVFINDEGLLQQLYRRDVAYMCGGEGAKVDVKKILMAEIEYIEVLRQTTVQASVEVTAVKVEGGLVEHVITALY